MKISSKILNLLSAFMAVIGICAAILVCFIVIYSQINGGFSSKTHNPSTQTDIVAQTNSSTINNANESINLSEGIYDDAIISSHVQNKITDYNADTETDIPYTATDNATQFTTSTYVQNNNNLNNGWVKEGNQWYYYESTGKMRTENLQTDVMMFTFNSDGSCSNFYDNITPSIQAGWCPYSTTSLDTLANDVLKGHVIYYNGQYWATPDYYSMIKNTTIVFEHDIATDNGQSVEPVDRYRSANFDISLPNDNNDESLTGLTTTD